MIRVLLCFFFSLSISQLLSQPTQFVRGTLLDRASSAPVPFASISILNTEPLLGGSTDSLGNFSIPNVPVGRYDLKISCLGFEQIIIREVAVISARQTVLNILIKENATALKEVIVKPAINKERALNSMATVSARMLSVEEAKRYAGGFDDPSRLASAFAGVASNTGVNSIIVRGNAPKFLQWKMEGIEIQNPNHFGDLKTFGGGILTGLSSQMLANSDFFTGAFPAEYNNAVSGVFDIFMRKGNAEKKEHTLQIGIIGIDAASEGPFRKGGKSTYHYNYRSSTLALLEPLLPENAEKIKYQDLSFKFHFSTKKAGTFSIWGIGLTDGASAKPKPDSIHWVYKEDKQKNDIRQKMGAIGLSHTYFVNHKTYIKTTLSATGSTTDWKTQTLNKGLELQPYSKIAMDHWNYVLSAFANKKFTARLSNRTGILVTRMSYDMFLDKSIAEGELPVELVNSRGNSNLLSAYSSTAYNISEGLVVNLGLNGQFFTLNKQYSLEPRIGFRQAIDEKQSIGLAYGLHSRLENINFYFNNSLTTGEKAVNKNLDYTRAHHLVLSYDYSITDLIHLKVEPYFQKLFSVPVIADSSFSFINLQSDWFFDGKLQNTGEGRNFGVDITLEKYISRGYYYLLAASVFDAKYKGGDGIWRNSRFNRNFVGNVLLGKEWQTGKTKQNTIGLNTRLSYQGGNRYSPVNETATQLANEVIYDETKAFSNQAQSLLNIHFTVSYKINKKRSAHEIALKILNATRQADFYGYKFNLQEKSIEEDIAPVVLPNLSYKIEF